MNTTLITERLILRPTDISDAPFTLALLNTKEWIENIGDRGVKTLKDAELYITEKTIPQLKQYGFGNFTVLLNNEPIGNTGVYIRDGMQYPDLGFAFLPQYFGKGYAFEAATAVLQFMKSNTKIKTLHAITLPANKPSVKLLNKLGFDYIKHFYLKGDPEELILLELKIK